MIVDRGTQKLFYSVYTSYIHSYLQLVVLKEWKKEIGNYGSSHAYMFCNIHALKVSEKAVKNACERVYFWKNCGM